MQYYKVTNKRLSFYKKTMDFHSLLETTWNTYIEKLKSLKNEKGVRLVPDFSDFMLGNSGAVYMLPRIAAFRFRYQIQLKAIRDKMWVQVQPGIYVLSPKATIYPSGVVLKKLLTSYTASITIYTFYKELFGLDPVPFGSKDAPAEINKAVEEKVKELCDKGTGPVVMLVPRFFVTNDDIAVIGLPEQMPYVNGIKELVDKKYMVHIDEDEAKKLHENRKIIIKVE